MRQGAAPRGAAPAFLSRLMLCIVLSALTCDTAIRAQAPAAAARLSYDPLAHARRWPEVGNPEAVVPSMCYTRTDGISNPCWMCHTDPQPPNSHLDLDLQESYTFSDYARTNRWTNLFVDRSPEIAAITDAEIDAWVRDDNYGPLRVALAALPAYRGFRPDLDYDLGFDAAGFARDGSGWRALRYKPFPGTFWPTNGSTDDVAIRLPEAFRATADGTPVLEIYRLNLALVEASLAGVGGTGRSRRVEPVDEGLIGFDLDGDGSLRGGTTLIRRLPPRYAGRAADITLRPGLHPPGTEYLHTVRYLDPTRSALAGRRMKEVRWSRKEIDMDMWALNRATELEGDEKDEGRLPIFAGSAEVGTRNPFGWILHGFIEDEAGRLRVQTLEEQRSCMGCHGSLGVTLDTTFTLPRKVPGAEGWRPQDIRGLKDAPQEGHTDPEVLTWFRRAGAGDEFRANDEITGRFFRNGILDEAAVRRAAPGGDRDLRWLLGPTPARARALNKAYLAIVRSGSFREGRDPMIRPPLNVQRTIETEDTGLAGNDRVFRDGRLRLDWR